LAMRTPAAEGIAITEPKRARGMKVLSNFIV
jgi:hypothetical protein